MKKKSITNWLLVSGMLSCTAAMAGNDADTASQKIREEIIPVEIKGIRVGGISPYSVSNLRDSTIRKLNNGQDIPYVLNHTPSVVISSDAGAGVGYSSIRIRGTDPSRINFTINGIPVNDAESQSAVFVDFPDLLSGTNSIQIQRGVGSSTNGSGTFGASVNLSNAVQSYDAYAEINNSIGSFNTFKHTVKGGTGKLSNGFQFDLRLSKISSDGYIDRAFADMKAMQFIAGWTSENDRTNVKFNLFTGVEKTGQSWNGVSSEFLSDNRTFNELGVKEDGTYYDDQTDNYQQDYYQLFFNHQFNTYWSLNTGLFLTRGKGFYNEYRLNQKFSNYGLDPFTTTLGDTFKQTHLIRQLWLDNYYYGGIYNLNYQSDKTQITIGGSVTQYDGKHYGFVKWSQYFIPANYRWYDLDAHKFDFNIYAKLQQSLTKHLYGFVDLQYRNVDYSMLGFRDNPELKPHAKFNFFNPKVGLTYINDNSKAHLSFAVANKEPNRNDFEASPASLPKHESLYDLEMGYHLKGKQWSLGADLYYMYYKNQLILTGQINDVGSYTRFNVPKSYRTGIELQGSWKAYNWLSLTGNFTISENKILDFTSYVDDYDNGTQIVQHYAKPNIAFAPSTVGSAIISLKPFEKETNNQVFSIDIIGKHVGKQYLDNTQHEERSIEAYQLLDLKLNYDLVPKFCKGINLNLSLNNVLNKMYVSNGYTFGYIENGVAENFNYYYPQAGFNVLLGLNIRF